MTILNSSQESIALNQSYESIQISNPHNQLRVSISSDEESCNDTDFVNQSIVTINSKPSETIIHDFPAVGFNGGSLGLPPGFAVQNIQHINPMEIQRVSVENFLQFQDIAENNNQTLSQIFQHIDEETAQIAAMKAKQEFINLDDLSDKIFIKKNGYNTLKVGVLCGDLIDHHNRYADVYPWSHNIVQLNKAITTEYCSTPIDYVNASKVKLDGVDYVSCSAPLPASFNHFWQMIFEQGSNTVVMLTKFLENRRVKAHCYFPGLNDTEQFGDLFVTCTNVQAQTSDGNLTKDLKTASIILRTFKMQCGSEEREIQHFQYTEWPDMGRPNNTQCFINLLDEVNKCNIEGPIITHCSAGIGRAGTFILLNSYCRKLAEDLSTAKDVTPQFLVDNYAVNIASRVLLLREQRGFMVQRPDQYIFIKEVMATIAKNILSNV